MHTRPKDPFAMVAMLDPVTLPGVQRSAASAGRQLPEATLMAAILADAIHSIQKHKNAVRGRARREFLDACRWIFSPDHAWPFAFQNVCDTLGLNPGAVRRVVAGLLTRANPAHRRNAPTWRI